ncbi:MAG: hypothetical protein LC648_02390 [Novosphingobium sp.]|nr:hypothetical protein [Novosphingobium sp.]
MKPLAFSGGGGRGRQARMASSDSYDPKTWRPGDPPAGPPFVQVAQPPVYAGGTAAPAWLSLTLSAAVLLGGAMLAYSSRADSPVATERTAPG